MYLRKRSGIIPLALLFMSACGGNIDDSDSLGGASNNAATGGSTLQSGGMGANHTTTSVIFGLGGTIASSGGASSARQALGGKSSTGGTTGVGGAPLGGKSSTGGKSGVGGAPLGGKSSTGGATTGGSSSWVPRTGGIPITDGYFEMGEFHGTLWLSSDIDTARRPDVMHSTCTYADDETCVTGNAARVPLKENPAFISDYDYSEVWGIEAGWNLNQVPGGDSGLPGPPQGADFSDVYSMTINLEGAAGLILRVQLETRDSSGNSTFYCAALPTASMPQTIDFNTLRTNCWQAGGISFDHATMQPTSLAIQVVASPTTEYPVDFCVTELELNSEQVGG